MEHLTLAEADAAPKICALEGCTAPVPKERLGGAIYCSVAHSHEVKRRQQFAWRRQKGMREQNSRSKAFLAEAAAQVGLARRFRLIDDPRGHYRPPVSAPVRRYANGQPMPFQDDLRAVRDYGSPWRLSAPETGYAWKSVLA